VEPIEIGAEANVECGSSNWEESVNLVLPLSGSGNGVFCWPLDTFLGMLPALPVLRSTEEYGQTCLRLQAVLKT
jgi:hypothetical protein